LVLSDIHYACDAEKRRPRHETRIIVNPFLRSAVRLYRHFVWQRDPFSHNYLLDDFLQQVGSPDLVVANGDYSCDTAFVGVSDDASFKSAQECLDKLRQRFKSTLQAVIGDHELGKFSLVGRQGGLRIASWHRARTDLGLEPFWRIEIGNYVLMGVTSSLIAFPVYEPEALLEERERWLELRETHLAEIRQAFASLKSNQRVLLFCHDPTALPFLSRDTQVCRKLNQVEHTIIGHLHSNLILWKSRLLSGMPAIRFLGNAIQRMSTALNDAHVWRRFKVKLCPALAGIELLKDGGFCEIQIDEDASSQARFTFRPLQRRAR
jgi:Calcineurin-like phosphoesterase